MTDALRCGAQVVFNPKDTNTFASASLDRTVKVGPRYMSSHSAADCSCPASDLCLT